MDLQDSVATEIVPASDWNDDAYRARFEELYAQLRTIARRELRGFARGTLDTTVLVHEAYLKLDGAALDVSRRGPFLALAAKVIRCVLIDHVRARGAHKRGGDAARVTLSTDLPLEGAQSGLDVLDIERGLRALEAVDPRLATVIEFRFYAGMEFEEIARHLGVTSRTVHRDWRKARAFLLSHLGEAA
ncbi:ECF-type sigma factor [Luteimonas saliphila]|uniref:ECF-type sigma factor n=1 Tax=Luteimonas saliphila TaxID=2804919 RepID=UPI00192D4B09|nr:ECF-type sigma factor [Luteimonas saliphila]